MLIVFWLLNFAISTFNAWGCGKTWTETKARGGAPHFVNWMGAVMSASGFTWCYGVIAAFAGSLITMKGPDGHPVPVLTPQQIEAFCALGYLVVLLPILGSGLALTVHAWGVFWRRRTFGSGGIAAYDTLAMIYNMSGALRHAPTAARSVGGFFSSKGSGDRGKVLVALLVVAAAAAGIFTTWAIIRSVAKSTAINRGLHYSNIAGI